MLFRSSIARLSEDLENDDLLCGVQAWIQFQPKWLLVLDNADDLDLFGGENTLPNIGISQETCALSSRKRDSIVDDSK